MLIPTNTLTRYIYREERNHPESTGELSDLLTSIAVGVKMIAGLVATAGFKGLHGYTGRTNVQGEDTVKLDEEADEILVQMLADTGHFGSLVSEERDTVVTTDAGPRDGKYVLAFDPLDGSSNVGSNIPVGTIFTIFRKRDLFRSAGEVDYLQSGRNVVAAGYSVYGAKTSFVYSVGDGVHDFTLDRQIGEFLLTEENIRMPAKGRIYSFNESYSHELEEPVRSFLTRLKQGDEEGQDRYSGRYVGSLVADFDRNLRKGGVFLYPATRSNPKGKLRLLYECLPLAFIAEQAGGIATDGARRVVDITPDDIHQRCPFIVGGKEDLRLLKGQAV